MQKIITFNFQFGKLNLLNKEGKLDIFIHNSRAEFLNDVYDFPKITVKSNDVINAKVEKTNLESTPRMEKPCIEDKNIPIGEVCLYTKVGSSNYFKNYLAIFRAKTVSCKIELNFGFYLIGQ